MLVLDNAATYIRRELAAKLLKLFFEDRLEAEIDRIPIEMYPRKSKAIRCCNYKDRAITRYRIMALLGMSLEEEDDEIATMASFTKTILKRKKVKEPVLTVIDEACSACVKINYVVTDICRACVARPCENNCPKNAITVTDQAKIDQQTCVNCGICKNVCPYNAIAYVPVPCEEQCPVDAISKDESGREVIDYTKCIYCGKCTRACPFGAIMERSQIFDVAKHIKANKEIIAMVAPSIIGQFPGSPEQLSAGLKLLGFTHVLEVAEGADITAKNEAAEFIEKMAEGEKMLGTSCCPAYTEAVKKHAQEFEPFVSHTKTPMSFTADIAATKYPKAIKLFIGPCIAKKFEGLYDPNVDYVLTYEELGAFFMAKDIDLNEIEADNFDNSASPFGRGFGVAHGVTAAVKAALPEGTDVTPVMIDGLTKKGVRTLKAYGKGKAPGNLIEVMSCEGGCINGPGIVCNPKISARKLNKYLEE